MNRVLDGSRSDIVRSSLAVQQVAELGLFDGLLLEKGVDEAIEYCAMLFDEPCRPRQCLREKSPCFLFQGRGGRIAGSAVRCDALPEKGMFVLVLVVDRAHSLTHPEVRDHLG